MGRKTEALLEQMADVVVNVNQECIASAMASFDLDIKGAKEVVISGLDVRSDAKTKVARCESTQDVDVGLIQTKMSERLDEVVRAAQGMEGDEVSLKVKIKETFTVNSTTNCTAVAIASTALRFANTKGNVTIRNVKVNQVARAQVAKCISNLQVRVGSGTRPLKQFIEDHEDEIEVTPLKGGVVAPDGRPIRGGAQSCPTTQSANSFMKYSVAGSVMLVVLVALVLAALVYTDDDDDE